MHSGSLDLLSLEEIQDLIDDARYPVIFFVVLVLTSSKSSQYTPSTVSLLDSGLEHLLEDDVFALDRQVLVTAFSLLDAFQHPRDTSGSHNPESPLKLLDFFFSMHLLTNLRASVL